MPVLTAPDEHTLALPVLSEQEVSQAIEKLTQHMLSVQNAEAMGPATHAAWSAETDVYCKVIDELVRTNAQLRTLGTLYPSVRPTQEKIRCLEESIQPFTDTEITDFCKENERLKPIHRDLSTACQTPKSEWRKDVGMRLQRAHHDLTEFSRTLSLTKDNCLEHEAIATIIRKIDELHLPETWGQDRLLCVMSEIDDTLNPLANADTVTLGREACKAWGSALSIAKTKLTHLERSGLLSEEDITFRKRLCDEAIKAYRDAASSSIVIADDDVYIATLGDYSLMTMEDQWPRVETALKQGKEDARLDAHKLRRELLKLLPTVPLSTEQGVHRAEAVSKQYNRVTDLLQRLVAGDKVVAGRAQQLSERTSHDTGAARSEEDRPTVADVAPTIASVLRNATSITDAEPTEIGPKSWSMWGSMLQANKEILTELERTVMEMSEATREGFDSASGKLEEAIEKHMSFQDVLVDTDQSALDAVISADDDLRKGQMVIDLTHMLLDRGRPINQATTTEHRNNMINRFMSSPLKSDRTAYNAALARQAFALEESLHGPE